MPAAAADARVTKRAPVRRRHRPAPDNSNNALRPPESSDDDATTNAEFRDPRPSRGSTSGVSLYSYYRVRQKVIPRKYVPLRNFYAKFYALITCFHIHRKTKQHLMFFAVAKFRIICETTS